MTVEPFAEPVCVVIVDEDTPEDEVLRLFRDSLPLRVVSWQSQSYVAAITALRPQIIAVWAHEEALVRERCQLIASLFSRFEPTVLSVTLADPQSGTPRILVQQLGAGATVAIRSLIDIQLP